MYLIDYHIHSNNSFDSKETIMSVCEAAIEKGINEICFTEHFSVKKGLKSHGFLNLKKYSDEIRECREIFKDKLIIRAGIEICEPHENKEELKVVLENIPFDFILGSVHNFDYNVSLIAYMDVIAHLDLMKRYAFNLHGNYDFKDYKEEIEEVLKNIINAKKGIEVNTSTLRSTVNETMPSIDILKMYYDLGGEIITVGSDSHKAEDVGAGIKESIEVLKAIGFKHVYRFEGRQAIPVEI